MNTLLKSALCLGATIAAMQSSEAQVLAFGNNTGVDTFTDSSGVFQSGVNINGTRAIGFTTGGVSVGLDHFTIPLRSTGSPVLSVSLWTGTGSTLVTEQIAMSGLTMGGGSLSATMTTFTFTPNSAFTLNANTTYWLVLENDAVASSTVVWGRSASGAGVTPTASNGSGYANQGGFTSTLDDGGGTTSVPANIGNLAVYTTTAVPEPREYAMIAGLGLCAFAAYRRRATMAKA